MMTELTFLGELSLDSEFPSCSLNRRSSSINLSVNDKRMTASWRHLMLFNVFWASALTSVQHTVSHDAFTQHWMEKWPASSIHSVWISVSYELEEQWAHLQKSVTHSDRTAKAWRLHESKNIKIHKCRSLYRAQI